MTDEPILAAEAELVAAQMSNDVAALDRLLDDELMFVGIDGSIATKQDDLDAHRARRLRLARMHPMDRRVLHVADGIAVVCVLMDYEGTWDGAPIGGRLRYTRIWREHDGAWRIVAGHLSPVGG